jgi:formate dehydrogenase subunit beta
MRKNSLIEVKNKNPEESITLFLKSLLEQQLVEVLLVPKDTSSKETVVQTLIAEPEKLEEINPIAPVMPVNSAIIVSKLTKVTASQKKVGILVKSCEIRALIELTKLKQAAMDNLFIIGIDCLGTYSVNEYKKMASQGKVPTAELLDLTKNHKEIPNLRLGCTVCEYPVPQNTDLTIGVFGLDFEKHILVQANTKIGEEVVEKLGLKEFDKIEEREKAVSQIIEERKKKAEELAEKTRKEVCGLDNLISLFTTCIGCHNCMKVCPICYCKECLFESATFEFESERYFRWVEKKKVMRMPKDTMLFHMGRMNHMLTSCVGCGMCEQGCPSNIELLKIFKMVGTEVQKIFDYIPGRSLEEELPISTFKEEELEPR